MGSKGVLAMRQRPSDGLGNNTGNASEAFLEAPVVPFIPASTILPEITPRAVILGILLAILLAASSTFLGLKIARTISGSIPAALISMIILSRFRNSNILENNMVQTIASAGEVVATGIIFTLPALILMGYWQSFDYFQTVLITLIGGLLGVLFSVPLRRSMVVKENLPYPEGFATGEVLMAGENKIGATKSLLWASLFSAGLSFLQTGLKIAGEQVQYWTRLGPSAIGGSLVLSPVLMAAGYIVGMRGLIAFIVGGVLTWGIGIPLYVGFYGIPVADDLGTALSLVQKEHFRFIAIGILVVGGLWSVMSIAKQIKDACKTSWVAMKTHRNEFAMGLRTERDLPFKYVIFGIVGIAIPTFFLFLTLVNNANFGLESHLFWATVIFATLSSLVIGFIAAAIAAYIVGIVGTTSLPVSGITLAAIVGFSSILLWLFGNHIDFKINSELAQKAAAMVIIFASIICVAAMLSGDNMQDLKAGQLVGATPWKQQLMLAVGAVASAFVIPFILNTTFDAYGFGDVLPRMGMDPKHALPAPQANLMATVAKGFFGGQLPWTMIYLGGLLALVAIIYDEYLRRTKANFRFPPLLLALGIYLPFGYVTAFFVGGLIHALVWRKNKTVDLHKETNSGILCASGIIAGEAILGALLTIPFSWAKSTDVLAISLPWLKAYETLIGVLLYLAICVYLYKQGVKHANA